MAGKSENVHTMLTRAKSVLELIDNKEQDEIIDDTNLQNYGKNGEKVGSEREVNDNGERDTCENNALDTLTAIVKLLELDRREKREERKSRLEKEKEEREWRMNEMRFMQSMANQLENLKKESYVQVFPKVNIERSGFENLDQFFKNQSEEREEKGWSNPAWQAEWQQFGGPNIKFDPEHDVHPVEFLEQLKNIFKEIGIPERAKLRLAIEALRGSARHWVSLKRDTMRSFREFEREFTSRYWDSHKKKQAFLDLKYGQFHGGNMADYFLEKTKQLLYAESSLTTAEIIHILRYHFDDEINRGIAVANFTDLFEVERYLRNQHFDSERRQFVPSAINRNTRNGNSNNNWQNRGGNWRNNETMNDNRGPGRELMNSRTPQGATTAATAPGHNSAKDCDNLSRQGAIPRTTSRSNVLVSSYLSDHDEFQPNGKVLAADGRDVDSDCALLGNLEDAVPGVTAAIPGESQAIVYEPVFYREFSEDALSEVGDSENEVGADNNNKDSVVYAQVQDKFVNILVDSGSDHSCISENFLNVLKLNNKNIPTLPMNKIAIQGALASKSAVYASQQVLLKVNFGQCNLDSPFIVIKGLTQSIILGLDWLKKHNVVLCISKGYFIIETDTGVYRIPLRKPTIMNDQRIFQIDSLNTLDKFKAGSYSLAQIQAIVNDSQMLNDPDKRRLFSLLSSYQDIFSDRPGLIKNYKHKIELRDCSPFKQQLYPIPHAYRKEVDRQIQEMLDYGVISRAQTEYVSALVVVKKKDGSLRVCVDARQLNKRMVNDHVIPINPNELLFKFTANACLSTLDMASSYWQVEIDPESKKYTGFMYRTETYVFNVLPFGLSTSVASFLRAMKTVLGDQFNEFTLPYVDDLLVFSEDFNDHLRHLGQIFEKFRQVGITLKLRKCKFAQKEVLFIGHIISPQGIRVDPCRVEAVRSYPVPRTIKHLKQFMGLINYERRFCPGLAQALLPLQRLLKKDTKWSWTEREDKAFIKVKSIFSDSILLSHPVPNLKYYVETDASDGAVASALYQINPENGSRMYVAFHSRSLRGAEINYTISEKEALSVLTAMQQYRVFVLGKEVVVRTDHKALTFLFHTATLKTARLSRWVLLLQEYNFLIEYVPGSQNIVSDVLSRNCPDDIIHEKKNRDKLQIPILEVCPVGFGLSTDYKVLRKQFKNFEFFQKSDAFCIGIFQELSKVDPRPRYVKHFLIHEGCLFFIESDNRLNYRIVVPKCLIKPLIKHEHENSGHFGSNKCLAHLTKFYYWPKQRETVRKFTASCLLCQMSKSGPRLQGEMLNVLPKDCNEIACADLLGPLPVSRGGVAHLLVIVDAFSKHVSLFPLKRATRTAILNRIKSKYITDVGVPNILVTDNGSQFSGKKWVDALAEIGIKAHHTSSYFPQANETERVNKEIVRLLRAYCYSKHSSWALYISSVEKWLNQAVHESTGCTPNEVHFNQVRNEPLIKNIPFPNPGTKPKNFIMIAKENLFTKAEKRRIKHDANKVFVEFEVGDKVLVRTHGLSSADDKEIKKFFLLYRGPATIIKKLNSKCYEIVEDGTDINLGRQNIANLRKYREPMV